MDLALHDASRNPSGRHRPAARTSHDPASAADVVDLIDRFQRTGNRGARDEVMKRFDWLAIVCARRMCRRGEPLDDLVQVAREGLVGAIERFDCSRGTQFKSFASTTMIGVLRHHYRGRWQVRVARSLQELHLAVMKAIDELTASTGRSPTVDELAAHLHVERDDVMLALEAGNAYRAIPLEGSADEPTSVEISAATGTDDPRLEATAERTALRGALATLPERDQAVLVMRFFEERTQAEIGEQLGISQVHASRLIRAALARLRDTMAARPRDLTRHRRHSPKSMTYVTLSVPRQRIG